MAHASQPEIAPLTQQQQQQPQQHQEDVSINPGTRSAEAARRKRERDRNCQRRKRERDRQYTACLEERIRELVGQLERATGQKQAAPAAGDPAEECSRTAGSWSAPRPSPQWSPGSTAPAPRRRRSAATEEEDEDEDEDEAGRANKNHYHHRSQSLDSSSSSSVQQQLLSPVESSDPVSSSSSSSSETVAVSLYVLKTCLAAPRWARLPLHGLSFMSDPRHCVRGSGLPLFIQRTRADAGQEGLCPPRPKVIDILYGGSKNPLANIIVEGCSGEPLLAPERLAISWAVYQYCRWLIWPSEETFADLPRPMYPTAMQLTVEHQWCIDLVVWPQLRDSMIRNQSRLDMDAVIGLFMCSLRMRGSFNNTNFISRQNEGDLEINSEFYRRFTDPDNWGLLETFWTRYPDLVEGLDPSLKIGEQDLIAS
ncbi:hypothetical protein BBO_08082 [Beauveria brongniartii RCEF 3172]|uniref:BZIP domain-containing protein n=1 Tax=Beauveria brongniartii RCEF 3172 TaxID=1081107 RepID=A0A166YE25_9HYPO|nr:hypothetical protein BBO_08082 [Beauveria brongniartii RCEF 3172]